MRDDATRKGIKEIGARIPGGVVAINCRNNLRLREHILRFEVIAVCFSISAAIWRIKPKIIRVASALSPLFLSSFSVASLTQCIFGNLFQVFE